MGSAGVPRRAPTSLSLTLTVMVVSIRQPVPQAGSPLGTNRVNSVAIDYIQLTTGQQQALSPPAGVSALHDIPDLKFSCTGYAAGSDVAGEASGRRWLQHGCSRTHRKRHSGQGYNWLRSDSKKPACRGFFMSKKILIRCFRFLDRLTRRDEARSFEFRRYASLKVRVRTQAVLPSRGL